MTAAPALIIFDCDGVLIDSEVIANRVLGESLLAAGFGTTLDEVMDIGLGKNEKSLRLAVESVFGRPLADNFMPTMRAAVMLAFSSELKPMAGIGDLLAALRVPFCVASNSHIDRVRYGLEITGLLRFFEPRIFTAAMVAQGKPAPDLFLHAAAQCGAAAQHCLVIEDSAGGIAAAQAAGMPAIGFCGGSHCRPGHGEALSSAGCDRVFPTVTELAEYLSAL